MDRRQLIDLVLEQIRDDVQDQDFTAIDELLQRVPLKDLLNYLPESITEEINRA